MCRSVFLKRFDQCVQDHGYSDGSKLHSIFVSPIFSGPLTFYSIKLGVTAVLLLITKSRANKVDMCVWYDQSNKDPTVGILPRRILVLQHLLLSWHHFTHN